MSLVLASASASRAQLLKAAGLSFDIEPADIDEEAITRKMLETRAGPSEVALALAEGKALKVSARRTGDTVVGGDQVLAFAGDLIGKCASLEDARRLLARLRGKSHALFGGLAIAQSGATQWRHESRCDLTMRRFSDGFLDSYLEREGEAILASVGAYRLEGEGVQLFERVKGSYFAVLGLDLVPLLSALRSLGAIPS